MALPSAVQKQIDEANRLIDELNLNKKPPESRPDGDAESSPPPGASAPPAGAPTHLGVQQPAPQPQPSGDSRPDFEQQYRVLQGKYNAEVPRLNQQNRELNSQLQQLRDQMQQMRDQMEAMRNPPAPLVTPEEVTDYTPELMDVVGRRAREVAEPEISRVRQEVQSLRGELAGVRQVVVQTAQERVLLQLDREVEDWRTTNDDEGFSDWLDQIDPLSKQRRREMFNRAYSAGDGNAVVAAFKAYRIEHAATHGHDHKGSQPGTPRVDLREFVAPGKAPAAGAHGGAQPEKQIWTSADIDRFYADVRRGVFNGREAEQRAYELDLASAQREGRIR